MAGRGWKGGRAMGAAAALILLSVAGLPTLDAITAGPPEDASCERHVLRVKLLHYEPMSHRLVGWLCALAPYEGQTVIITSPTGLMDHAYWDWPVEKDRYSYVRHATQAGYAVFNYDRMGTGQSERPNAALVTLESEAFVLHQLVRLLRAGAISGVEFGKVVTVGNSFSTFISVMEAELYHDVDGVINTGIFVGPHPQGLVELFAAFYPAQLDPKFADQDIPPGYATTQPGSRDILFYLPAADPATVALDEQLKDTATVGEAATFPHWWALTRTVDVPVLSVVGDHDFLFCRPECEPGGPEAQREEIFWSPETCLEIVIVEDAGHSVQLHAGSAAVFDGLADDWLARRVGMDDAHPPSAPCAA